MTDPSLPTFDEAILIGRLAGDEQLAAEVLRDFETTLQRAADRIEAAFRDSRVEDLIVAAHELKSSSRAVGAMQLGELCERLEAGAQSGPPLSSQPFIAAVMTEIAAVARRLHAAGG